MYFVEPAQSRILLEASKDPSNPNGYEALVRAMKKIYINTVSITLARSELRTMEQQPNETVSAFSTRFSRCIKRAYPADDPDRQLQRQSEEFVPRLRSVIRLHILKMDPQPTTSTRF